jgi:hypothetical protein
MSASEAPFTVETGAVYELTGDLPFGGDDFALPSGALVTVLDVVDQGTPGVGRSETDTVIASYRYYDVPTRTAEGEWVYLEHIRHLAFAMFLFQERFAPSDKDPTPVAPEGA